jgi:hypothetical protein
MEELQEGSNCPNCTKGVLIIPPVENCSCHISPPCNQCLDNNLVCDECGWEEGDPI